MAEFDFAVVGAGIAGASLAAMLAPHGRILVLEAEARAGYHSTGRSAAFWAETYGGPGVQPLTAASGAFLREHGFLSPRRSLTLAREPDRGRLEANARRFAALGVEIEVLERMDLEQWIPGLMPGWTAGVLEPDCSDIDVAGLHQLWLGEARRGGAEFRFNARLETAERVGGEWRLGWTGGSASASVIIDAAGAWADPVARICGVRPLGITPYRRTVAQLHVAPQASPDLPLVLDIDERFYFKPESGRLWLSPHDETPSLPCDAAPEEIDVATAIARMEEVVDWRIERVEHRWAGLRSFAPDRLPVYGFAPETPGFFWFAGQGGFGIQTAPAAAALAVETILGGSGYAVDPATYSPVRFV